MGLMRHDGEVEGVVTEDDAVLVLAIRGRLCKCTIKLVTAFINVMNYFYYFLNRVSHIGISISSLATFLKLHP